MSDITYNDVIKNLKNQLDNGTVSKKEIASDLKIETATTEQKEAVKTLEEIIAITGKNPVEIIKQLKENEQSVKQEKYENLRSKLMTEAFGPEKIDDKINLKREAAEPHVLETIQDEKVLKEQIEKADQICSDCPNFKKKASPESHSATHQLFRKGKLITSS